MRSLGLPLCAVLILLPATAAVGRVAEDSAGDPAAPTELPPALPPADAATEIAVAHVQHGPLVHVSIAITWPGSRLLVRVLASSSALGARGSKQVKVGGYSKTVPAGLQAFSLAISAPAEQALHGTGQLPVEVKIKVTPPGGDPFRSTRKATLILLG